MSAASPLWQLPRQAQPVAVLRGACAREEVGHAWAFLGPADVGQERLARALAAALNCPQPLAPGEPCGTCSVCDRCSRGAFAAYREFVPVGMAHRVTDVREQWLQAALLTPAEGRWKVLRICDADRMNEAAANAFLKGLEEPADRTTWILDIADPDVLPDTILSRCRGLRLAPWRLADLLAEAERLGLADPDERELAARVAQGSPGVLRRLAAPGGLARLRAHCDLLRGLRERGPGFAVVAARGITDEAKDEAARIERQARVERDELAALYADELPRAVTKELDTRSTRRQREARIGTVQAALDDLAGWIRDCLAVAAGGAGDAVVHRDALPALHADADALGPAGLLHAAEAVLATRERLERNVQPALALEAVFLELSALALAPAGGPARTTGAAR